MNEPKIRLKGFSGEGEILSFNEVFELRNGYTPSKAVPGYWNNGTIPWFRMEDIRTNGGILSNAIQHITPEAIKGSGLFKPFSYIIATTATIGEHAMLIVDSLANQQFTNLSIRKSLDSKFDPYYVYYYLFKTDEWCKKTANAGGLLAVNIKELMKQPITRYEIKEQQAIASYFQHLDSLIQSTTKKIESLKQVKVASLQSMFPQEGETTPRVRFKGFDGEWEMVAIKDIAIINPKTNIPNQFKYVDLESVVGTEMKYHRTETKETAPSRAQRLASKGDIFYQTVRPYQKNNYYFDSDEYNYVFSSGYAQIRALQCGSFLFALMQQEVFVQKVMDNCTGTSFPAINANVLGTLEISITRNEDEQKKIADYFTNLDSQITLQTQRLEKLKQIKSACLDNMFV